MFFRFVCSARDKLIKDMAERHPNGNSAQIGPHVIGGNPAGVVGKSATDGGTISSTNNPVTMTTVAANNNSNSNLPPGPHPMVKIGHYVLGETLGIGTFGKVKSKSWNFEEYANVLGTSLKDSESSLLQVVNGCCGCIFCMIHPVNKLKGKLDNVLSV